MQEGEKRVKGTAPKETCLSVKVASRGLLAPAEASFQFRSQRSEEGIGERGGGNESRKVSLWKQEGA